MKRTEEQNNDEVVQETKKMPQAAMYFMDHECFASVSAGDGENDQLLIVTYSGGIIKGHWYWGDLVIDLEGMSFPKKKYPVLENHDTSKKIAFAKKPQIDSGALVINDGEFVDTPESHEFRKLSKEGFPYESSLRARPTIIESVVDGEKVKVNGMTVKGPATIWRKSIFKEASICVFGWDSNTKAVAFADDEVEVTVDMIVDKNRPTGEEVTSMKLDEFKEKHSEAFATLVDEITTEVKEAFAKEKTDLEATFAQEKKDLTETFAEEKTAYEAAHKGDLDGRDARIQKLEEGNLKLEKSDTLRTERERKAGADKIWTDALAESDIPEHVHAKAKNQVRYTSFMKDGSFDTVAFSAAVKAEIESWEKDGITETVLGSGFSGKDVDNTSEQLTDKEDEKLADGIFDASGGTREEVK